MTSKDIINQMRKVFTDQSLGYYETLDRLKDIYEDLGPPRTDPIVIKLRARIAELKDELSHLIQCAEASNIPLPEIERAREVINITIEESNR